MPMSELSPVPRQEVARLFVESWKEDLRPLCKHMERWVHALAPALVPERVYVAVRDGEVLGMAVCSAGAHRALHVTGSDLREHLGLLRGTALYPVMSHLFHKKLRYPETTLYIEGAAVAPASRGQGIATRIFEHLHTLPYEEFVLDVVDTNPGAVRLYERLGYRECERHRAALGAKYKELIYMRRPGHR